MWVLAHAVPVMDRRVPTGILLMAVRRNLRPAPASTYAETYQQPWRPDTGLKQAILVRSVVLLRKRFHRAVNWSVMLVH